MALTDEQNKIIEFAQNATDDVLILVNAVAGSGKTFLLTELVKQVPHSSGVYLAYNKSVATEAAGKFPKTISCSTTHAMAYRATVKPYNIRVGTFTFKSITDIVTYEVKASIVDAIREFCLSHYLSFDEFAKATDYPAKQTALCKKYLGLMWDGTIECTHDFYMKVFHIHLADGSIKYPKQDILMVDEAGDLNAVTLEIFKLLPAKIKIAVGDESQNIYAFNHTINAFKELKAVGTLFSLTKSFRVSDRIAERIQRFCNHYVDPTMRFSGVPVTEADIVTTAFIGRTNSALIGVMNDFRLNNTDYSLVRKAAEIFKLPLILCYLKYQGTISDPSYQFIQTDVDDWYESTDLKQLYKNPLAYLAALYDFDKPLANAIKLVAFKGKQSILDTYEHAKKCEGKRTNIWLATAHSVKGLEFDAVTILDDLNQIVTSAQTDDSLDEEYKLQEYNLYYVACSRARKALYNATAL